MRVGFTGTRAGMTTAQWETFEHLVTLHSVTEWHDGDCIGADTQARATIERFAYPVVETHGHPCNLAKYRAHNEYDVMHKIKPPLVRNRDIVNSVDLMFAAPAEFEEVKVGSGTWATIRYTDSKGTPLIIVWPDGSEERRNGA